MKQIYFIQVVLIDIIIIKKEKVNYYLLKNNLFFAESGYVFEFFITQGKI